MEPEKTQPQMNADKNLNRKWTRIFHRKDTEDTKRTLNKSADYTDYADFGFELRQAGRNERKLLS
jgi:hypothetical protein